MMIYCYHVCGFVFFFFKQKTAYELRISDWSSDVCSSDLHSIMPANMVSVARWSWLSPLPAGNEVSTQKRELSTILADASSESIASNCGNVRSSMVGPNVGSRRAQPTTF